MQIQNYIKTPVICYMMYELNYLSTSSKGRNHPTENIGERIFPQPHLKSNEHVLCISDYHWCISWKTPNPAVFKSQEMVHRKHK